MIIFVNSGELSKSLGLYLSESTNSNVNHHQVIIISQTFGGTALDYAYSVVATSDGGYALAGYTYSYGMGESDMWLVKTDAKGQVEWDQTFGGTNSEAAQTVIATSDGGYALAGFSDSYGVGDLDMWLVKTDANGQAEWNQTFGGTAEDIALFGIATSDGGYALAGRTYSYGTGDSDMWLVKTDANGQAEWNQTFGGVKKDEAYSVITTSDGGYALSGFTGSYGTGSWDMWLIKTNASGHIEWNQTFGGSSRDVALSVITNSDGGYVLAGGTYSFGAGDSDMWLMKTDANGQAEWNQTFGGTAFDAAYSVIATSDGGYALTGRTQSFGMGNDDLWLIKITFQDDITDTTDFPAFEVILLFITVLAVNISYKRKKWKN